MKCIKCGKYPFCNKIQNSQQEACEDFIKRKATVTVKYSMLSNTKCKGDKR